MHEMAEKIVELESKVKENELKCVSKAVEAPTKLDTLENVNKNKDKSKDPKEKKIKEKVPFFFFIWSKSSENFFS